MQLTKCALPWNQNRNICYSGMKLGDKLINHVFLNAFKANGL